mmetsp:Transcript_4857/g.10563  ORF Transcript_4857/g.10563 Transcript_4857/m.10563 type:complete len:629 (+) Transcript_4857:57-1943(+)
MMIRTVPSLFPLFAITTTTTTTATATETKSIPSQALPTPFYGQHVGVTHADLNGDGAPDLLFAAGRHWVDRSYALINLGGIYADDGDGVEQKKRLAGVRFSEALPIGPPGSYYQIDAVAVNDIPAAAEDPPSSGNFREGTQNEVATTTKILLVGGTCHYNETNSFGACQPGDNTAARVLHVTMDGDGCSVLRPDDECNLTWEEVWLDDHPNGDRNGGFAYFGHTTMEPSVVLLGQGGVEIFHPTLQTDEHSTQQQTRQHASTYHNSNSDNINDCRRSNNYYTEAFHLAPPNKTDERSDFARYAGFAAGYLPSIGGIIAAGRRSDFDAPQRDDDGNVAGMNFLIYETSSSSSSSSIVVASAAAVSSDSAHHDNDGKEQLDSEESVTRPNDHDDEDTFPKFRATPLPPDISGEPYPGNNSYSVQTTNYAFDDIDGDGIRDLLEATFLYPSQRVPGYPLPQRIHFLDRYANVKDTMVVMYSREGDAGRSVATGNIFGESELADVVFASARGVVALFANLGVDPATGEWRGLELRGELELGKEELGCEIRDVDVVPLLEERGVGAVGDGKKKCWVGIVCAVACGFNEGDPSKRVLGKNHVFYVKRDGSCHDEDDVNGADYDLGADEGLVVID